MDVFLVDDVAGSLTTAIDAAKMILDHGAKSVSLIVSHGLFLDEKDALGKLSSSPICHVYTTDSVCHRQQVLGHPKISVIGIAPLIAEAIKCIYTGENMSHLFPKSRFNNTGFG